MADARFLRRILLGCLFLAAYTLLAHVSNVKPYGSLGVTPWNPPPGLGLALMILGGWFYAPFVLLAPLLADTVVRGASFAPSFQQLGSMAVGLVYVLAGMALRQIPWFDPRFESVRAATIFAAAGILSAVLATGAYLTILLAAGTITPAEAQDIAWRASVGDAIGILVTAPLVLMIVAQRPWPKPGLQALLQFAALVCALSIVFGYREATAFQLFYLLFLPLLWIALVYGPPGSAVALALIQIGLIIGAEIRFGPDPGLGAMQVLMIALAITGLIVGTVVAEREHASARLREQQAALNRALRLRSAGEVAATIAHEINQPLTALTAYAGIASKAICDGKLDIAKEAVSKIGAECERATSVLKGIRELLRQGTVSPELIDIKKLLHELETFFADEFAKKGLRLIIKVDDNFPLLPADRVQVQQAVHNLILNSAEAILSMRRTGRIEILVTRADQSDCLLEVRDDGPGFPPGFNLADPAPFITTKPEGSGLGLAVARSIAEAHGGSLSLFSSARGASVRLRLPFRKSNT